MNRLVLQMGVTVDAYDAGSGHEGDWGLEAEHPDVRAWKLASLRQVGTHIMGRVTYEQMAKHWPNATDEYATFMNNLPKVVFSKTLPAAGWAGSRIARGDLAAEVAAVKRESGADVMAHGGASLSRRSPDWGSSTSIASSSFQSRWDAGCLCSRICPSRYDSVSSRHRLS